MTTHKIDSNVTGLSYAEEASLGVLPVSPVWYPLDPNSYSDFGGQIKTVARDPINASRQRKKGVTTDLDASGGFQQDLTQTNLTRMMQGVMFASVREKKTTKPMNAAQVPVTGVTASSKTYAAASGLSGFKSGNLVLLSGFGIAANNGLKTVASDSTGTQLVVNETCADEASPPADAIAVTVGFQFPTADVAISMNGSLVRLTASSTDLTTLGLIAGEWIYLGGDAAGSYFTNNRGYARISKITTGYLEFDKTTWTGAGEAGTAKTIRIFFGTVLKNEKDPALIVRRSYQVERSLGEDDNGTMSEYLIGAVANQFTLNVPQADKVTADLSFVAIDNEQRDGATGLKAGTRISLPANDPAFNTSSDFNRIKLSRVDSTDSAPTPLFAYATELKISVNNKVTPTKAIAVLGAFDTTAGTFEVGGNITAYFADIAAVQAVRNNADITLDMILSKDNAGMIYDIPLMTLGGGRLNVSKDNPITLPLEIMAAESSFGHTLLFQSFAYLPSAAM